MGRLEPWAAAALSISPSDPNGSDSDSLADDVGTTIQPDVASNSNNGDFVAIKQPHIGGDPTWHALDMRQRSSWPERTICTDVEPNEAWETQDWDEIGQRRCPKCKFLIETTRGEPASQG